jgi:hypothetical protein
MQLSHNILSNLTRKVPSFVETELFLLSTGPLHVGWSGKPRGEGIPKIWYSNLATDFENVPHPSASWSGPYDKPKHM